jgi:DNA-binding response OmpR family regulator
MLSRTLSENYQVDVASDAATALDLLRTSPMPYNLLIADLKMPGMDGLTLIRQVKAIRSGLPIIIITGFSTESSAIEAVNLGVAGYLTKPFHVPQVLAAAARAMGA